MSSGTDDRLRYDQRAHEQDRRDHPAWTPDEGGSGLPPVPVGPNVVGEAIRTANRERDDAYRGAYIRYRALINEASDAYDGDQTMDGKAAFRAASDAAHAAWTRDKDEIHRTWCLSFSTKPAEGLTADGSAV